jgi:hypothetical protein
MCFGFILLDCVMQAATHLKIKDGLFVFVCKPRSILGCLQIKLYIVDNRHLILQVCRGLQFMKYENMYILWVIFHKVMMVPFLGSPMMVLQSRFSAK